MKKTMINDQPYSIELKEQIDKKLRDWMMDERLRCMNNQDFNQSDDIVTFLFEKTDKLGTGLGLDFQTNASHVSNETNYESKPKIGFWDKYVNGTKLDLLIPMSFTELMNTLSRKNTDFKNGLSINAYNIESSKIDANWNVDGDTPFRSPNEISNYVPMKTIEEDLTIRLPNWFGAHERIKIDPNSDMKVAIYHDKHGQGLYVASLAMSIYTGIGGAPGRTSFCEKVIKATVAPKDNYK